MSAWKTWDRRQRTFAVLVAAVVVGSIVYALNIRFVLLGDKGVTAVDDLGEAFAAATASAACMWAASRSHEKDRLGWSLMAISAGLWAAGEVAWSVYEVFLQVPVPQPGLPDVGFLSAVPFAVGGIRAFWSPPGATSAKWRIWFDGVIVAIALLSTAWGFGLRLVWDTNQDFATKTYNLSYPLSDILVGTVLILAIRRAREQQKGRLACLLVGVACYSISDSAFAYLTAQNAITSVGNLLDTGWFTGFLMIALAAIYPPAPSKRVKTESALDLWQLALPWMTLLTAAGGDFYTALSGHDAGLFQPSMTVILAVLLTVNMILERREFLEMLTNIEQSRTTLSQEFKTALVGIKRFSGMMRDAERIDVDHIRHLAAEIHAEADRLDRMIEEMVKPGDEVRDKAHVQLDVSVAAGEVLTAGSRS